jgi:hypothetical protein
LVTRNRKEISTSFVKIGGDKDEVKELEGTLMDVSSQAFANGSVGRYRVKPDDQEGEESKEFTFLGSTVIDDLMRQVEPGTYFWLTYTGKAKTGNNRYVNQFKLEVEEA